MSEAKARKGKISILEQGDRFYVIYWKGALQGKVMFGPSEKYEECYHHALGLRYTLGAHYSDEIVFLSPDELKTYTFTPSLQ